jgi:hypothetical protein
MGGFLRWASLAYGREELGSYGLFLQEQIKDIITSRPRGCVDEVPFRGFPGVTPVLRFFPGVTPVLRV